MRRLVVSLTLVAVPAVFSACGKTEVPPEQRLEQAAPPVESHLADTSGATAEKRGDTSGAVTSGKGCPANTVDSARITEDLILCGERAMRGADLATIAIDSVPFGAGKYLQESRSFVPANDTTRWLIVTRRVGPDVLRLAQGPVAETARTLVTLQLGVRAADSIGFGCRQNHGQVNREIVAVVAYTSGTEWLRARRAWRFVRSTSNFEVLPPNEVECLNEEGD